MNHEDIYDLVLSSLKNKEISFDFLNILLFVNKHFYNLFISKYREQFMIIWFKNEAKKFFKEKSNIYFISSFRGNKRIYFNMCTGIKRNIEYHNGIITFDKKNIKYDISSQKQDNQGNYIEYCKRTVNNITSLKDLINKFSKLKLNSSQNYYCINDYI